MMRSSPSLFFDILGEEDEDKRDEKIKRASFEIKRQQLNGAPSDVPTALQQRLLAATATGPGSAGGSAAADDRCNTEDLTGSSAPSADACAHVAPGSGTDVSAITLTPQEVLQELLGDLFIPPGRLEIGEQLGQGGFADVHKAELTDPLISDSTGFKEVVAVKRLRPDALTGPAELREFLTEANLLRKLAHRNIVQLRGVGASNLSDLVSMRESMFVVQEFMEGGDLKAVVLSAMTNHFNPPYSKGDALTWAMHIAEAMHYLHSVCRPMIIHRDLKLDNVLLTGGPLHSSVAKLADFGLHKRVRRMINNNMAVPWTQDATYHGIEYERSFYGGQLYLARSALSDEGSIHGATAAAAAAAAVAAMAAANGDAAPSAASCSGGTLKHSDSAAELASQKEQLRNVVLAKQQGLMGREDFVARVLSSASVGGPDVLQAAGQQGSKEATRTIAAVQALESSVRGGSVFLQQQQQQQQQQQAMANGLQHSSSATPAGPSPATSGRHDVAAAPAPRPPRPPRGSAARSAGSASAADGTASPPAAAEPSGSSAQLSPALVAALGSGVASPAGSCTFIEATQKVGSLIYMAPEVLMGHTYNEKVDVFSFGIILYELMACVLLAGRVAMAAEHDELLDYARSVANGHREALPMAWPAPLRELISSCWAQEPADRPSFKEVMLSLRKLRMLGVHEQLDALRPKGAYNPATDCGCSIM